MASEMNRDQALEALLSASSYHFGGFSDMRQFVPLSWDAEKILQCAADVRKSGDLKHAAQAMYDGMDIDERMRVIGLHSGLPESIAMVAEIDRMNKESEELMEAWTIQMNYPGRPVLP